MVITDILPCEETAEAIRKEGGDAIGVQGSVTSEEDCKRVVEAAVQKFGKVTGLISPCMMFGVGQELKRVFADNAGQVMENPFMAVSTCVSFWNCAYF